ncbi:hypothetical protein DK37_05790 [Halomonas sp. SUBG004]|nr:hypothetical protein DK37_05790 [Halomonas sp. SUBG004]
MYDALAWVVQAKQRHPVLSRVMAELLDHRAHLGVGHAGKVSCLGGHIVVGNAKGQVGSGDGQLSFTQLVEGMERPFMDKVTVYPQQALAAVAAMHFVGLPHLVE